MWNKTQASTVFLYNEDGGAPNYSKRSPAQPSQAKPNKIA
jgi:hypothetical protein